MPRREAAEAVVAPPINPAMIVSITLIRSNSWTICFLVNFMLLVFYKILDYLTAVLAVRAIADVYPPRFRCSTVAFSD